MMDLQNHENEMMFTMISLSKPDTLTYPDCILQSVEMKIFHTNKVKNTMMEMIKSMCLKKTRLMQYQEYFGSFEQFSTLPIPGFFVAQGYSYTRAVDEDERILHSTVVFRLLNKLEKEDTNDNT